MAILESDIKLLRSERMLDTPDGGGRRTSHAIIDGQSGNIFPKISRLDSTYGRVNLRKIYAGAMTANLDTYAGAHAAVMDAPENGQIHVTIFSTGSDFDNRTDARDRIESYVVSGPESRMTLYGRQLSGQQSIQVYQRPEETLPNIGDVYCLSKELGGITAYQQYIRVGDLQHEVRTFEDEKGTYTFRIIVIKIGAALRHEFSGPATPGRYSVIEKPALVRETTVADAARYYGIVPAAGALTHGSFEIVLDSIFSTIVPSTTRDVALSNVEMASAAQLAPAASEAIVEVSVRSYDRCTVRTGRAIMPGSLRVSLYSEFQVFSADDGKGAVVASSAMGFSGSVNYDGVVEVVPQFPASGYTCYVSYVPAVTVSRPAHTLSVPVTLATQGTVYAQTLLPAPAPCTVSVSYRALGRWYALRDDGAGAIAGLDPSYGAGSIDYATGALVVTLGALPDVDSALQLSWGSRVHQTVRAGQTAAADSTIRQVITLVDLPIAPNTLTVTWESGGVTKTAADAGGTLIGHASGTVNRTTGRVVIEYAANIPDSGTALSIDYDKLVPDAPSEPTYRIGSCSVTDITSINLGGVVTPGGLELGIVTAVGVVNLCDDGNGKLFTIEQTVGNYYGVASGQEIGTVNYVMGMAAITAEIAMTYYGWTPSYSMGETSAFWSIQIGSYPATVGHYTFRIRTGAPENLQPVSVAISAADAPLQLDLTRNLTDTVVPESVVFDFADQRYIDRAGTLYTAVSTATGSGLEAGTLDYETGIAKLRRWRWPPMSASTAL